MQSTAFTFYFRFYFYFFKEEHEARMGAHGAELQGCQGTMVRGVDRS